MLQSYVYIISNKSNDVLYIGVTSDLVKRIYEHKEKLIEGFSTKYNLNKLVYFEVFDDIKEAIKREKQLKNWQRKWKEELIIKMNPEFDDLYNSII
ncbi:MAG: GIY-YIG nuclease family protein [Sulfurimonadaceae bacterium]|jgi:putative endonuclease|nr:GIY-YIG nuclease family protein [Sulfurimonadaceae bacterium]